ncbi:hypothetical protein [Nocardia sp. NPDC051832]|uniref:hypothetical protein n=1 Tax=Nocardia sp. NPDC051832 TaxID=3155673 RepID=UPI003418D6DD
MNRWMKAAATLAAIAPALLPISCSKGLEGMVGSYDETPVYARADYESEQVATLNVYSKVTVECHTASGYFKISFTDGSKKKKGYVSDDTSIAGPGGTELTASNVPDC